MIEVEQKGDFSKTMSFLQKAKKPISTIILNKYGKEGVRRLSAATPKDTGLTAASWNYEIKESEEGQIALIFSNSNINKYVNIAIILDTGHATGNGGWVQGLHYIDPALRPVFEKMPDEIWKEVVGHG